MIGRGPDKAAMALHQLGSSASINTTAELPAAGRAASQGSRPATELGRPATTPCARRCGHCCLKRGRDPPPRTGHRLVGCAQGVRYKALCGSMCRLPEFRSPACRSLSFIPVQTARWSPLHDEGIARPLTKPAEMERHTPHADPLLR